MVEREIIKFIKDFVTTKFGDDVIAIYGIGSSFNSNVNARDIDVVVVLKNLDKCPKYKWTSARFEKQVQNFQRERFEIWFLYNTLEGYMNKNAFKSISFANWEWSVRSLKHASELIMGEDIRERLPEPLYDYNDILVRCAYHLEPSSSYKLRKVWEEGLDPQEYERNRFTKSIFKFGFLLIAYLYPDDNIFNKEEIYDKLLVAYASDKIDGRVLDFYDLAIEYRGGASMPYFEQQRKEFLKLMVRESIYVFGKSWIEIKSRFQLAFGKKPFSNLLEIIRQEGWE